MLCSGSLWGVGARIPGFLSSFDEKRRKNEVLWPKTGWKMLKVVVFGLNFGGVQRPKKVGFGMTLGLLRPQNCQTGDRRFFLRFQKKWYGLVGVVVKIIYWIIYLNETYFCLKKSNQLCSLLTVIFMSSTLLLRLFGGSSLLNSSISVQSLLGLFLHLIYMITNPMTPHTIDNSPKEAMTVSQKLVLSLSSSATSNFSSNSCRMFSNRELIHEWYLKL